MQSARLVVLWLALASAVEAAPVPEDPETFFETRIRPVLVGKCWKCHGGEKVSSGLRVDSRESLVKGGKHGAAIVPGEPEKGLLVDAVRRGERKMPPDEPLPAEAVADLAEWVRRGAPWPERVALTDDVDPPARHWAFQPVHDVPVPDDPTGWS